MKTPEYAKCNIYSAGRYEDTTKNSGLRITLVEPRGANKKDATINLEISEDGSNAIFRADAEQMKAIINTLQITLATLENL